MIYRTLLDSFPAFKERNMIIFCSSDNNRFKLIDDTDIPIIYECLGTLENNDNADLFLYTRGGSVDAARKIALLLRGQLASLNTIIPYKAQSAGLLICLAATAILCGPMAEFSPLDPLIETVAAGNNLPNAISSEDIRAFKEMSAKWFGVEASEGSAVLGLLAQRIFPTSLSTFYRLNLLIHEVCDELLSYQIGDEKTDLRRKIIEQLISRYHSHGYKITRDQARKLGLNIVSASADEELQMWTLLKDCHQYMRHGCKQDSTVEQDSFADGMIASDHFTALHIVTNSERHTPQGNRISTISEWRIIEHGI